MKKHLAALAAVLGISGLAAAAQAATIEFDQIPGFVEGSDGAVVYTEDGFEFRNPLGPLRAHIYGTNVGDGRLLGDGYTWLRADLGLEMARADGGTFGIGELTGMSRGDFAIGYFQVALEWERADGTTGTLLLDNSGPNTLVANLTGLVRVTMWGTTAGSSSYITSLTTTSAVPLPGAALLFGTAAVGVGAARRRGASKAR